MTTPASSLLVLLLLVFSLGAAAEAPRWNQLSTDQQRILDQYRNQWDGIPESRRQRLADNARRWSTMSPEERQRARKRHEALKDFSEQERQVLRQSWQSLSQEQRQRLRGRLVDMPPDQRREALDRFLRRQSKKR